MVDEPDQDEQPETAAQRVASVFMGAWAKAKAASMPGEHASRHSAIDEHAERLEREIAPVMAKILGPYLESDALPPEWREVFQEAIAPEHTYGFLLAILEFFGAVLTILPALGAVSVQPYLNQAWAGAPSRPLSPADLADAVVRNVPVGGGGAVVNAAMSGIAGQDFNTLVAITGEPPGPVDMLKLWLRGAISTAELDHAIRYSRIRDEFIPAVHDLAYSQMTPADAIMAAIKQVVPQAEARALFVRGGGLDSDFEILYQAAGDSISIQQVLTLERFGLATPADVDAALGRSRINPMFYPLAKKTHFHPLPPFQITRALTSGTITPAVAETWLVQDGVPQDQAHALATAHGSTGTAKAHQETESLVVNAYNDHLLSEAQAITSLEAIGYHPDVATLIVEVANAKRAMQQQTHTVDAIRTDYVDRRIDRGGASAMLDRLQIPVAARDHWLATWDIEIAAHPKTLTPVQLADAAKKAILTPAVALTRIEQLGYTPGDAAIILELHGVKP
jgi:hypothetical protein